MTVHFFSTLHTPRHWNMLIYPILRCYDKSFSEPISFENGLVMSIGKTNIREYLLRNLCEDYRLSYVKCTSSGRVINSYLNNEDSPKMYEHNLFFNDLIYNEDILKEYFHFDYE